MCVSRKEMRRRLLRWISAACCCAGIVYGAAAAATDTVALIRSEARPLTGDARDYDELMAAVGDASIVMLGEATHGSRELYRERVRITRRLVEEKGFQAVVLEAPWEPLRRLDAYVRGVGGDADAAAALGDLKRFPRWPTRNPEIVKLAEWLRGYNRRHGASVRVFGMDIYSLPESARAVANFLAATDPEAAAAARRDYACFEEYLAEPQNYGYAVAVLGRDSCGAGAQRQLAQLQVAVALAGTPGETLFAAWQSAHTAAGSEAYYRAMYRSDRSSWNLREHLMADTLDRLRTWLAGNAPAAAKIVVWAQNMHQGDARATDQAAAGEVSLGQLMRERHPGAALLVGFNTYRGEVRAAARWGEADRVWRLKPALPESWPALLHAAQLPALLLVFANRPALAGALSQPRPDRAVGVTYRPQNERAVHYFTVRPAQQFDALIHWDATTAVGTLPETTDD